MNFQVEYNYPGYTYGGRIHPKKLKIVPTPSGKYLNVSLTSATGASFLKSVRMGMQFDEARALAHSILAATDGGLNKVSGNL